MTLLAVKVQSNIRTNEAGVHTLVGFKNKRIIQQIENKVLRILRREAPVRSGKFKQSIKKIESVQRQNQGDFRGFVLIGPTVLYSKFVVRKTRPSQGTYVPVLDARIRFGRHPGTRANNFISRNMPRINTETQAIVDQHYGRGRFDITRFIKQ